MALRKKIAIFCDGTWNDLSLETPTNVVRLAKSVAAVSQKGEPQIVYYDEGVGVGAGIGRVTDSLTKYVGGALGRGLDRKIEAAYRFLVLNYCPGDHIYIFGFSRGAYTARSLCGLIRKCGILRRDCFDQVPSALGHYRSSAHPDSPEMIEFRQRFGHALATGWTDAETMARVRESAPDLPPESDKEMLYQYRPEHFYRMMFVGIWDTVGALGVPSKLDFFGLNRRYRFHDTSASSLLSSIRHAVAANERRSLFDVTLFNNIDQLNGEWATHRSASVSNPGHSRYAPYDYRPYQQRWFPGDHSSVGGGGSNRRLSSCGLLWIADGAQWAGLTLNTDATELRNAVREQDVCGNLGGNGTSGMPAGRVRAEGPAHLDEVSDELSERWSRMPGYRPPNITVMAGAGGGPPVRQPPPPWMQFP